jgi:hypothetical protein
MLADALTILGAIVGVTGVFIVAGLGWALLALAVALVLAGRTLA